VARISSSLAALLRQSLLEGGQVLAQLLARALRRLRNFAAQLALQPFVAGLQLGTQVLQGLVLLCSVNRVNAFAGQPDSHPGQQTKGHYAERQQRPYQSIIHVASVLTATVI
jgi:hypothetical protein